MSFAATELLDVLDSFSFIRWFAGQGRRLLLGGRRHFTILGKTFKRLVGSRTLISAQMVLLAALVDHCNRSCLVHERQDKGCIFGKCQVSTSFVGKTHSTWDSHCRKTRDRLGGTSHSNWVETLFSDITCELCHNPHCQCQHHFDRDQCRCQRRLSWFQHQRPQQQQ